MVEPADNLVFALPGQVRAPQLDTESLLPIAKRRAPDPSIFDERPPFFWLAEISNDNLDSYFSRMHDSTLKNFARDATKGVSFQNSHDFRSLGLGHSLTGEFIEDGKRKRVEAAFYTVPGIRLNDVATDDFIAGVRSGVLRDVSVGFHGGTVRCGICGDEMITFWGMYFSDCEHVPGLTYDVEGKKTVAFAWHHDGTLSEVSQVYDGATPDAGILKARMMAEAGRLTPEQARFLESTPLYRRHRVAFPDVRHVYALAAPTKGERQMTKRSATAADVEVQPEATAAEAAGTVEEPAVAAAEDVPAETVIDEPAAVEAPDPEPAAGREDGDDQGDALAAERIRLAPHGIRLGRDVASAVRVLGDEVIRLREQAEKLRSEAADGRAYRDDLIEQLHSEGVRAFGGQAYDRERWQRVAGLMSMAELKATVADFAGKGTARFPGGRETQEHDAERGNTGPAASGATDVPDAAYRAGRTGARSGGR